MRSVKLEEGEGESSRCGDQVFGSRVTPSTLAGEYVTARDYVGGRASGENCWDMNNMYETRTKEEVMTGAVRDVEEWAVDCGVWGRYDPPKLWISLFSFVFFCLCQGKGGGRHERGAAKRG